MSDQVLRVRDHYGRGGGTYAFLTLCLQFVDECLIDVGRGRALPAGSGRSC